MIALSTNLQKGTTRSGFEGRVYLQYHSTVRSDGTRYRQAWDLKIV